MKKSHIELVCWKIKSKQLINTRRITKHNTRGLGQGKARRQKKGRVGTCGWYVKEIKNFLRKKTTIQHLIKRTSILHKMFKVFGLLQYI